MFGRGRVKGVASAKNETEFCAPYYEDNWYTNIFIITVDLVMCIFVCNQRAGERHKNHKRMIRVCAGVMRAHDEYLLLI